MSDIIEVFGPLFLMEKLYSGKVKTVYQSDVEDEVLIEYHDKVTAGNGAKESVASDKGKINAAISALIFEKLEAEKICTHYIGMESENVMRCKNVEIIPMELVVRNIASGSIVRNTTIPEGKKFYPEPIIEFFLKDDEKNDPLLNDARIMAMGMNGLKYVMMQEARRINKILKPLFESIDLDLVDYKLEFGLYNHRVILADEISPDGCRLWKKGTTESMDKDLFRKGEGDIVEAYSSILESLKNHVK